MISRIALVCALSLTFAAHSAAKDAAPVAVDVVEADIDRIAVQLFRETMVEDRSSEDEELLPQQATRQSLRRGVLSGLLQLCRRDWEEVSFFPFMAAMRATGRLDGQKMSVVGFFHGFAQGRTVEHFSSTDTSALCTSERVSAYEGLAHRQLQFSDAAM